MPCYLFSGILPRPSQTTPGFVTENLVHMWRCGSPWTNPTMRQWATRRVIKCCGHMPWPGTRTIKSSDTRREDRSVEVQREIDWKCLGWCCVINSNHLNCHVVFQVSLALHMDWVEPAFSFSREDVEPAKRVLDFRVGWFAEPIFGKGDYPLGMRSWLRQLNSLEYK